MRIYYNILFFGFCFLAFVNSIAQSRIQNLSTVQYKQNILISFIITPGSSCTGYQIQRSSDSVNFEILYDYNAICGDLTKPQSISFTDEKPLKNSFNYYRIFIPPQDYSNITSVIFSDISENGYLLYSNPITETLVLLGNSKGILKVYNQTGKLVNTFNSNEDGLFREDLSSWAAGLFYFIIETNVGKNVGGKFIKMQNN